MKSIFFRSPGIAEAAAGNVAVANGNGQSNDLTNGASNSVDISYDVFLIPQPDKFSCWAASMAMLVGYARKVSIEPESLAREVGRSLRTSYGWDMLEEVKDHFGFQDISLPSNASLSISVQQWADWLNVFGPLWVTMVGSPSHAIVVKGLSGDMTPEGTTIDILNPWDINSSFDNDMVDFHPANNGTGYSQSFKAFTDDFGRLELDNYGDWRVLYLPATAQLSGGNTNDSVGDTNSDSNDSPGKNGTGNQDKDEQGRKLLQSGIWSSSDSLSVEGGQGMHFVVKNTNALGTTLEIDAGAKGRETRVMLPFGTTDINFSCFGSEPMGWNFDIATQSDAFMVTWKLYSTWVPGDPNNG